MKRQDLQLDGLFKLVCARPSSDFTSNATRRCWICFESRMRARQIFRTPSEDIRMI